MTTMETGKHLWYITRYQYVAYANVRSSLPYFQCSQHQLAELHTQIERSTTWTKSHHRLHQSLHPATLPPSIQGAPNVTWDIYSLDLIRSEHAVLAHGYSWFSKTVLPPTQIGHSFYQMQTDMHWFNCYSIKENTSCIILCDYLTTLPASSKHHF